MIFMNTDIQQQNEYIMSQIKSLEDQNKEIKNKNNQLQI